MTDEIRARIDELAKENLKLKEINDANEEKMKSNRRELGKLLKQEGLFELRLPLCKLTLVTTRNFLDYEYLESLPGYRKSHFIQKVSCTPFVKIGKSKPSSNSGGMMTE